MNLLQLNWLAVVIAFVAYFAIGAIWFGPKTFFPVWSRALGKDPQKAPATDVPMPVVFGLTALGALVQVIATAVVIHFVSATQGPTGALGGALVGLLVGIGFVAASSLSHRLFAGQGLKVWIIEVGSDVLGLTVAGLIIGLIG